MVPVVRRGDIVVGVVVFVKTWTVSRRIGMVDVLLACRGSTLHIDVEQWRTSAAGRRVGVAVIIGRLRLDFCYFSCRLLSLNTVCAPSPCLDPLHLPLPLVLCVFFTLTDRTSTTPTYITRLPIRYYTWSAGQENIRGILSSTKLGREQKIKH